MAVIREWPRYWTRIKERGLVARYVPRMVGVMAVYCYLFACEETKKGLIID